MGPGQFFHSNTSKCAKKDVELERGKKLIIDKAFLNYFWNDTSFNANYSPEEPDRPHFDVINGGNGRFVEYVARFVWLLSTYFEEVIIVHDGPGPCGKQDVWKSRINSRVAKVMALLAPNRCEAQKNWSPKRKRDVNQNAGGPQSAVVALLVSQLVKLSSGRISTQRASGEADTLLVTYSREHPDAYVHSGDSDIRAFGLPVIAMELQLDIEVQCDNTITSIDDLTVEKLNSTSFVYRDDPDTVHCLSSGDKFKVLATMVHQEELLADLGLKTQDQLRLLAALCGTDTLSEQELQPLYDGLRQQEGTMFEKLKAHILKYSDEEEELRGPLSDAVWAKVQQVVSEYATPVETPFYNGWNWDILHLQQPEMEQLLNFEGTVRSADRGLLMGLNGLLRDLYMNVPNTCELYPIRHKSKAYCPPSAPPRLVTYDDMSVSRAAFYSLWFKTTDSNNVEINETEVRWMKFEFKMVVFGAVPKVLPGWGCDDTIFDILKMSATQKHCKVLQLLGFKDVEDIHRQWESFHEETPCLSFVVFGTLCLMARNLPKNAKSKVVLMATLLGFTKHHLVADTDPSVDASTTTKGPTMAQYSEGTMYYSYMEYYKFHIAFYNESFGNLVDHFAIFESTPFWDYFVEPKEGGPSWMVNVCDWLVAQAKQGKLDTMKIDPTAAARKQYLPPPTPETGPCLSFKTGSCSRTCKWRHELEECRQDGRCTRERCGYVHKNELSELMEIHPYIKETDIIKAPNQNRQTGNSRFGNGQQWNRGNTGQPNTGGTSRNSSQWRE